MAGYNGHNGGHQNGERAGDVLTQVKCEHAHSAKRRRQGGKGRKQGQTRPCRRCCSMPRRRGSIPSCTGSAARACAAGRTPRAKGRCGADFRGTTRSGLGRMPTPTTVSTGATQWIFCSHSTSGTPAHGQRLSLGESAASGALTSWCARSPCFFLAHTHPARSASFIHRQRCATRMTNDENVFVSAAPRGGAPTTSSSAPTAWSALHQTSQTPCATRHSCGPAPGSCCHYAKQRKAPRRQTTRTHTPVPGSRWWLAQSPQVSSRACVCMCARVRVRCRNRVTDQGFFPRAGRSSLESPWWRWH